MQTSVKVMDIEMDLLSNDVFVQKINEYLTSEKLQVVLFASTEMLNMASEDGEYRKLIKMAQLILPGEEALLTPEGRAVLCAGNVVVSCVSFGLALEKLKKEDRTLFLVSSSEQDVGFLTSYCRSVQPELRIVGSCVCSPEWEDVAIVNEINSHAPDFLLVDLPVGEQERWIMEHVSLLNARICVAIGGVADLLVSRQKEIPGWIEKIHLGGLYRKAVQEQTVKKGWRARIFRKRVVHYNHQAEEKREDDD